MNKNKYGIETFLICLIVLFALGAGLMQAAPIIAPAQYSGAINVKLYPMENIGTGTATLVTFGFPFPRGSVTVADLAKVRVLKNGNEIPAYVAQLTPWRHLTNSSIDGTSVRVARIQLNYTFSVVYSNYETITVEWGQNTRQKNVSSLTPVRNGWRTVPSGTFSDAPSTVKEPKVYAVLPKDYMCKGMFRMPMTPLDNAIQDVQDDGNWVRDNTNSGYLKYDYMQKNLYYTVAANNYCSIYTSASDPWLFDRSSTMYVLYFRSGFLRHLRQAVRNCMFYQNEMSNAGRWGRQPSDPKYTYNECLAYTYWITGLSEDDELYTKIGGVANWITAATIYNSDASQQITERHAGFVLLGTLIGYEVTGNSSTKSKLTNIINNMINWQNGVSDIPSNKVDGGLYHKGVQHDSSCEEITYGNCNNDFVASTWMSVFSVDAMVRSYIQSENSNIANFVKRFGNFMKRAATFEYGQRCASYLVGSDGSVVNRDYWADYNHAADTMGLAAWSDYFARLLGTPDNTLRQLTNDLYDTYTHNVDNENLPDYHNGPCRKYLWQYRTSASFSWALANGGSGSDTVKPTVGIIAPSNGATVSGIITLSATASDNVAVAKVQFFIDGQAASQEITTLPYLVSYNTMFLSSGNHTMVARAWDTSSNSKDSANIVVTVQSLPGCVVSTASNIFNQTVPAQSGTFTIKVDATPFAINGVINDTAIGVNQSPPLNETGSFQTAATVRFNSLNNKIEARSGSDFLGSVSWLPNNTYRIRLVLNVPSHSYAAYVTALPNGTEQTLGTNLAFRSNYNTPSVTFLNNFRAPVDGGGLQVCNIILPGMDTTAPGVEMTRPVNGATVSGTIALEATASDNVGVARVRFLADGGEIGTDDTTSPYSISFNTTNSLSNGSHTLAARASDAIGNTTTSAGVVITVTGSSCPASTASNLFNKTFIKQFETFTVSADVTPKAVAGVLGDTAVGVNQSPPVGETGSFQTAATVRLNSLNNKIEARSGSDFLGNVSWSPNNTYRIRLVLNVPEHKYNAYVTALPNGTEQTLGTNLVFRSNYNTATVTFLNNFRAPVDAGSIEVCNLNLPTCTTSTTSNMYNQSFTSQTGIFTVTMNATPTAVSGVLGDTGIGINQDPPVEETGSFQTAATVRFNTDSDHHIEPRDGNGYKLTSIGWTAGQTYRIRLVLNVPEHKYSAYVTALPNGTEQTLGTDLAFRDNYNNSTITFLNNFRASVDAGSIKVCNIVLP